MFGEEWDAKKLIAHLNGGDDAKRGKAADGYKMALRVLDEAAQTFYDQVDLAEHVGPNVNGGFQQRWLCGALGTFRSERPG